MQFLIDSAPGCFLNRSIEKMYNTDANRQTALTSVYPLFFTPSVIKS
ncbi:hypothetical protein A943_05475 [Bacillus sp. CPSM8]|nr:hypothetical protein A943_05475 [Bacillus sp. CPSM8]